MRIQSSIATGALLIVTASAVGCASVSGDLRSTGYPAGIWDLNAAECTMPRSDESAFSFVVVGGDGLRIGFTIQNDLRLGRSVTVQNLNDVQSEGVVVGESPVAGESRARCKVFGLTGAPDPDVTAKDRYAFSGVLNLDCQLPQGGHLVGELDFSNCPAVGSGQMMPDQ